jgi:hypothetical protein
MKRTIFTGVILLAGVAGLWAQQKGGKAPSTQQPLQSGQAAAAPKGPMPKSKGEQEAVVAMIKAQGNPDEVIKAAEALINTYADTDFKDTALFMEAASYQQKGDREKSQIYAERTVAANPKHYQALLMLSEATVQGTREHDLDRDDKLNRADKYANDAIAALNEAQKPNPQITDQQWEDIKKDLVAEAHDALGMTALQRKNYDVAIKEFKASVDGMALPQPAFEVRLASAYQAAGKYDEAIAVAEKVMNEPQTPQQIKSVAQAVRAGSVVAKNGGKAPATQAAPPQVEIKKQ